MRILGKLAAAIAMGVALAGCVNEPQQISDVHTGISAGTSKRYPVYQNLFVTVWGQAFIAAKGGEKRYGIYVDQIATGTGWSFFHSAYSFGVQLPYERGNSGVMSCSGYGCTLREQGGVLLSAEQFRRAAASGIELKLVGSGNSVVIQVPAEAFQQALALSPG